MSQSALKDEPHFIYGISVEENCHQQWNTVFSYSCPFRAPPLSLLPGLQGLRLGPCCSMYWISSTSWCFILSFLWYGWREVLKNHNKTGFLWSQSCISVLWKWDVLPASTAVWQIWCKAADFVPPKCKIQRNIKSILAGRIRRYCAAAALWPGYSWHHRTVWGRYTNRHSQGFCQYVLWLSCGPRKSRQKSFSFFSHGLLLPVTKDFIMASCITFFFF